MENQCTSLIHDILYGNFSNEEWLGIKKRFDAFMETATEAEIRRIEDSGAGDTISMISAGLTS